MIIARLILAILFATGAVIMVGVAALIWLGLIAGVAKEVHVVAGIALFVASLFAMNRWREVMASPWQMWMGLWGLMDDWVAGLQTSHFPGCRSDDVRRR